MYVAAHREQWARLEKLLAQARRPRRLTGAEVDELVELYQRVATHLSVLQGAGRDPQLVGRLSSLVARARSTVAGSKQAAWQDAFHFLRVDFPVVIYRARYWWLGCAVGFVLVALAWGSFIAGSPEAQAAIAPPEAIKQLVEQDFVNYYSASPAQDFAAKVFTNNAYLAASAVASGVLLGLPILYLLYANALNVGVAGGLLAANGKVGLFFGLILPHGFLELTAVFVASGLGLKIGWTVVDPGLRTRGQALAEEGRALMSGAIGLALVLFISGLIEAFVTPSPLPTWARIAIGVLAETVFLLWVFVIGRRGALTGATGDVDQAWRGDRLPAAG